MEVFTGWSPSERAIDDLKAEGSWNNDWDASLELIRRYKRGNGLKNKDPSKNELINVFNNFYFGGDPEGSPKEWTGFIQNEKLLVEKDFFDQLDLNKIGWGFVSGAEPPSAKFVLEERLGLQNPPLIAMGDAPEKPNPNGLIQLAEEISGCNLGKSAPPIAYIGDTVADILTINKARHKVPEQKFLSLGVAPPHLHSNDKILARSTYEGQLKKAGADKVIASTKEAFEIISTFLQ